jgi:hypothetical protein
VTDPPDNTAALQAAIDAEVNRIEDAGYRARATRADPAAWQRRKDPPVPVWRLRMVQFLIRCIDKLDRSKR